MSVGNMANVKPGGAPVLSGVPFFVQRPEGLLRVQMCPRDTIVSGISEDLESLSAPARSLQRHLYRLLEHLSGPERACQSTIKDC
jgi:hypothetical protein